MICWLCLSLFACTSIKFYDIWLKLGTLLGSTLDANMRTTTNLNFGCCSTPMPTKLFNGLSSCILFSDLGYKYIVKGCHHRWASQKLFQEGRNTHKGNVKILHYYIKFDLLATILGSSPLHCLFQRLPSNSWPAFWLFYLQRNAIRKTS